jgi:hypothetical protein
LRQKEEIGVYVMTVAVLWLILPDEEKTRFYHEFWEKFTDFLRLRTISASPRSGFSRQQDSTRINHCYR